MPVHDIDRPDVDVAPKMQAVADAARAALGDKAGRGELTVSTDDNLMSSVWLTGSLDPRETWANGIYENSRYFRFMLSPAKGARYYDGGKVTVELHRASYKIGPKFRKSTTTPEKAIERIRQWIAEADAEGDCKGAGRA